MRASITKIWSFPRVFRLILGMAAAIQGVMENELMLLVVGGLIALMAAFNVGCCGAAGCVISHGKKTEVNQKK